MHQEIEYAEMLEIPVSTVNVVRKKRRKKIEPHANTAPVKPVDAVNPPALSAGGNVAQTPLLKDTVIAQINERVGEEEEKNPTKDLSAQVTTPHENMEPEGTLRLDPVPERIDTVRLYTADDLQNFDKNQFFQNNNFEENNKNNHTMYAMNEEKRTPKPVRIALGIEFAAACALCGAIFFTNVFLPNSAINTFFRGMTGAQPVEKVNNRIYSDFELSPIVSDYSGVTLNLSDTGILSFTDECCVYPAADGEVADITKNEDNSYTMKIRYSNTFTGVFNGLDQVFYEVGDVVKENVPVAFSKGETEVQVTMYSSGELLNCFRLTEENCIAWVTEE